MRRTAGWCARPVRTDRVFRRESGLWPWLAEGVL